MNDAAAHDVVATSLLVALAVLLSGAFALVVRAQLVPEPRYASEVEMTIRPGSDDAWGTGDETVRTSHSGGESIPTSAVELLLSVNGGPTRSALASAAGIGSSFGIGEAWNVVTTIPEGANVTAALVVVSDGGTYLLDRLDVRSIA